MEQLTAVCSGLLEFEGQDMGLLAVKSHCIVYEVLRNHICRLLTVCDVAELLYSHSIQYCVKTMLMLEVTSLPFSPIISIFFPGTRF